MGIAYSRRKSKGSAFERDLMHKFWANSWAAVRAAGSGSTSFPCPDLIVGGNGRVVALEVKATKDKKKYFPRQEINELNFFAGKFGAEAFVAIRFDREDTFFIRTSDLVETDASFVASLELGKTKGFTFDVFISSPKGPVAIFPADFASSNLSQ